MARKKKRVELSSENIEFQLENIVYKVVRYYPDKMTLDLLKFDLDGTKQNVQHFPFAHLPREIKKTIKPN